MKNPFYFRELPAEAPFCNRLSELKELTSHALNHANVVLYSPRRYGKTSLVKRVQRQVSKKNVFTVYIDFFGVSSVDNLSSLLASHFYAVAHQNESVFKKIMKFLSSWRPVIKPDPECGLKITAEPVSTVKGFELLEETLAGLGEFIKNHSDGCFIVLDEFQEITEIPESPRIEGLIRSHVQSHSRASYAFVGSRRRLLEDMFNLKKRPFYQSAINYQLKSLPIDEAAAFIADQFKKAGVNCPYEIAQRIAEKVNGYPYYIQRIPYSIFEECKGKVTENDYIKGFRRTIEEESTVYELMLKTIAPQQIALLSALASEPTGKPLALSYMNRRQLGSIGGVQAAIKKLVNMDYIEKTDDGVFKVVDPVFGIWLKDR